jgi:hypothetical protein
MKNMERVIALLLCALTPLMATAEQPDHRELAISSLEGQARSADLPVINAMSTRARALLAQRLAEDPNAECAASVMFAVGVTPDAVATLAKEQNLSVTLVELKIPMGSTGQVITAFAGPKELLARPGSLERRINRVVGRLRLELYEVSQAAPEQERASWDAAAFNQDVRIFRAHVIGSVRSLASLSAQTPLVSHLFLDESKTAISDYRALENKYAELQRNTPPPVAGERRLIRRERANPQPPPP